MASLLASLLHACSNCGADFCSICIAWVGRVMTSCCQRVIWGAGRDVRLAVALLLKLKRDVQVLSIFASLMRPVAFSQLHLAQAALVLRALTGCLLG